MQRRRNIVNWFKVEWNWDFLEQLLDEHENLPDGISLSLILATIESPWNQTLIFQLLKEISLFQKGTIKDWQATYNALARLATVSTPKSALWRYNVHRYACLSLGEIPDGSQPQPGLKLYVEAYENPVVAYSYHEGKAKAYQAQLQSI
jgi:hypothetical protein